MEKICLLNDLDSIKLIIKRDRSRRWGEIFMGRREGHTCTANIISCLLRLFSLTSKEVDSIHVVIGCGNCSKYDLLEC